MLNKITKIIPTTILVRYFLKILLVVGLAVFLLIYAQVLFSSRTRQQQHHEHSHMSRSKLTRLNRSKINPSLIKNLEFEIDAFNKDNKPTVTNSLNRKVKNNQEVIINNPVNNKMFKEWQLKQQFNLNGQNNLKYNEMSNLINNDNNNQFQQQQIYTKEQMLEELSKLERIVHIDLKGAPPKLEYFDQIVPMLKENGATGVLVEYEDMFPYEGSLAQARHGNAYSLNDIKHLKDLFKNNSLKVMPLVQTYGHLEWVLKIDKFKHLRDNFEYPQVITQCLEESYKVLFDMLDQVINQHLDAPYFHIGCDEVYYKLMHPSCANTTFNSDFNEAFMSHLVRIAGHVKSKLPKAKIIFWNDMLNNMPQEIYEKYKNPIVKYELEPMIWAYVLNLKTWFQGNFFDNYAKNFPNIWAATAYKGAGGELATVTNIQERNQNHITWIETIVENHVKKVAKFRGIALTGWSRYDHFLALCELLPQAIPSLIFNLRTTVNGPLTQEKIEETNKYLGCQMSLPWTVEEAEMRYGSTICSFPGNEIYSAVVSFKSLVKNVDKDMEFAKKYMTPTNLRFNYLHKSRADEALTNLEISYSNLVNTKDKFLKYAKKIYWDETYNEWLLVHVYPQIESAYQMITAIKNHKPVQSWKPRPLNVTLKDYPSFVEKSN